VQIGGGIHVAMPDAWDGKGEVPPGWSSEGEIRERHERKGEFAVFLPMSLARDGRLSASEKTEIDAARATAVAELPADWTPPEAGAEQIDIEPVEEVKL
jgi:hypothetical protein